MIKAFFTGDIVNTKGTDFLNKDLVDKISKCDISVCNLEAPIAKKADTKEVKVGPTISQNKNIIEQLKGYGFNLFGMANNHIYDYYHHIYIVRFDILETVPAFMVTKVIGILIRSSSWWGSIICGYFLNCKFVFLPGAVVIIGGRICLY